MKENELSKTTLIKVLNTMKVQNNDITDYVTETDNSKRIDFTR